jgi:hypothetical protein
MNDIPPHVTIPVGVVVERRKAKSAWIDYVWRPVAVLPGEPGTAPWTQLDGGEDVATFYVGGAEIELLQAETTNYRDNLASGTPLLWVVLRPTGVDPPYDLVAVTADPAEGEGYTQTGDDLVDSVPMPEPVCATVEAFIGAHHVERVFYKRKRDRADPEALARRAPQPKDRPS